MLHEVFFSLPSWMHITHFYLSWWYSPLLWVPFDAITTTDWRLLVLNMSFGALVACADFLLCVFMCDGTVALCNCLKDTKTFGLGYTKGRVWCHVAAAPGGARRWRRGGQTWHATHTPWPRHTGKSLSRWSILGECFFKQTLGRFYGLIIEVIYWLSVWHACAHTCKIEQTRTNTYTNTEKQEEKMRCQTAEVTDGHTLEKTCKGLQDYT